MRCLLSAILLPALTLLAQEPAQPPPAKPAETPAKPAAEKPAPKPGEKAPELPETISPPNGFSGAISGRMVPGESIRRTPATVGTPNSPALPREYHILVAEAMKSFKARDFKAALHFADKADEMSPPTIWTINVRGAVAIEKLEFEEGRRLSIKALEIDRGFLPARFNLAEIPFLQGNYQAARQGWLEIYNALPKDDPTTELLAYRICLTYLLEKDMARAKEWLEKIPNPSQTPAYHYANAAWERQSGRMDKWKEWLEGAEFVWPAGKRADFVDVLIQLRWLSPPQ